VVSNASLERDVPDGRHGPPGGEPASGIEASRRAALDRVVEAQLGRSVRVVSVCSEPSRFATASPAEIVTVGLGDGSRFRLFVKRLDPDPSGNPDKRRRDREPLVYRRLLAGRGLPVPAFYSAYPGSGSGRHELFLEYIDDWNLKYHGLDHWYGAARALARLHAHFASRQEELDDADFLLHLDSAYFRAWALRAVQAVAGASTQLGGKLESALRRHDQIAGLLAEQPATLVHNDLAPKNVIADTSTAPARIFFVDWEMAGAGCGLLDLAHLKHGLERPEEQALCAAYQGELRALRMPCDRDDFRRLLAACDLQNTLYRLAHIRAWGLPPETAERWDEEVACLARKV
jgi:hypothetical protein